MSRSDPKNLLGAVLLYLLNKKEDQLAKNNISDKESLVIKALRAKSNDAIARRDVPAALSILRNDARVVTGDGQLCDGIVAMGQYFERSFADSRFVAASRNPTLISANENTAAEEGTWEGHWKPSLIQGKYLARWQRDEAGWRVAAELYIPLSSDDLN